MSRTLAGPGRGAVEPSTRRPFSAFSFAGRILRFSVDPYTFNPEI